MSVPVSITAAQFSRDWHELEASAYRAETLGFDGLFLFDHLVPLGDPHRPVFELASAIGAVAAVTTTLRIGTLVLRAPMRHLSISTEIIETAVMLAPGRFVLGVGAGDRMSFDEARRFGMASGSLDQRIRLVEELVTSVATTNPELPIWVGGVHPKVLSLVRDRKVGWNGWGISAETFAATSKPLHGPVTWGGPVVLGEDRAEAARLKGDRDAIWGDPLTVAARLAEYVDAGADELVVSVLPNRPERWELFANEVLPRLRDGSSLAGSLGS